jgi:hypothetical protein
MKRIGKWLSAGNCSTLLVAVGALLGLIGTAIGGPIWRWETIFWQAMAAGMALIAYSYSRYDSPN